MKRLWAIALPLLIPGCALFTPGGLQSSAPGQAVYHYKRTADSCEVIITSGRDVPGIKARVGKDCSVSVEADALTGQDAQIRMLGLFESLLSRIPGP